MPRVARRAFVVSLLGAACASAAPPPAPSVSIPGLEAAVKPGMLVVFGDIHGTAEIPDFVGDAARALAKHQRVHVGLEMPVSETKALQAFLSGDDQSLLDTPTWTRSYQDGRTSQAVLGLLRKLREARRSGLTIEVFFFDDPDRLGMERRDEGMV